MYFKLLPVALFSGIVSGMGIGGGGIFILLSTIFNIFSQKEAQSYNLIMFIVVGISSTIVNLKNKNIDKENFKKLIIPVCLGSIVGVILVRFIDEKILKVIFYIFMVLIGIYEIISSLKNMYKAKTNNGWKEEMIWIL